MIPLLCAFFLDPGGMERAIASFEQSGRIVLLDETPASRISPGLEVPPGLPPVLLFRNIEGAKRGRFGDLDLVVDDAGH